MKINRIADRYCDVMRDIYIAKKYNMSDILKHLYDMRDLLKKQAGIMGYSLYYSERLDIVSYEYNDTY